MLKMWAQILVMIILFLSCVNYLAKRKFSELEKHLFFEEIGIIKSIPFIGTAYILQGSREVVSNPEVAQLLLKTNLEKDNIFTDSLNTVIGKSSIVSPVPIWRKQRKVLIPTFSTKNLKEMMATILSKSDHFVEILRHKAGKGPFPMGKCATSCIMDSVSLNIMGIHLDSNKNSDTPVHKACNEGMAIVMERILAPWFHKDFVYKLMPQYKKLRTIKEDAHAFIVEVVEKKREQIEKRHLLKENDNSFQPFLEKLVDNAVYSQDRLVQEILMLLVAATDTSSVTICFIMLMLARHQEVQEKVYKELQKVFGDSNRSLELEDFKRMPYLEAVVKETLRLYPPSPYIVRKVTQDTKLPSGVTVKAGCGVLMSIWSVHRNQAYWGPDADLFRPERFLDSKLKHPAQFMPFSYGPRDCPGYRYALLSIKSAIVASMREYRVLLPPTDANGKIKPLRLTLEVVMRDADDFVVDLELRNKIATKIQ